MKKNSLLYLILFVFALGATAVVYFGLSDHKNSKNENSAGTFTLYDVIGNNSLLVGLDGKKVIVSGKNQTMQSINDQTYSQLRGILSPDGRYSAYSTPTADAQHEELHVYNFTTDVDQVVKTIRLPIGAFSSSFIWSEDSKKLFFTEADGENTQIEKLVSIDIETGYEKNILTHNMFSSLVKQRFTIKAVTILDSDHIDVAVSFEHAQDTKHYAYSLSNQTVTQLLPDIMRVIDWWPGIDPWATRSPNALVRYNETGEVVVYDYLSKQLRTIPQMSGGDTPYSNLSPDGKYLLGADFVADSEFIVGNPTYPGIFEVYIIDVSRGTKELVFSQHVENPPLFPSPSIWSDDGSFVLFTLHNQQEGRGQAYQFDAVDKKLYMIDMSEFNAQLFDFYGWDPRVSE